jgi:hypothetical protein
MAGFDPCARSNIQVPDLDSISQSETELPRLRDEKGLQSQASPPRLWPLSVTESAARSRRHQESNLAPIPDNQPSLAERLASETVRLTDGAKALRPGREQDAMVRKARLMETASQINDWLTSPGQRAPR